MITIKSLHARSILDSKGNPTVEVALTLSSDDQVIASAPSGTSVGKFEAHEKRDNDPMSYHGKGVSQAVELVNTVIARQITDKNPLDQKNLDELLIATDGTPDKSRLGANAMIAVSMAICKAGALVSKSPLYKHIANITDNKTLNMPKILSNLINGGLHAGRNLDIQEFLVIPYSMPTVRESLKALTQINDTLRDTLVSMGQQPLIGDEGGFAPRLEKNENALELLETIITTIGYKIGSDIFLGMDAASNSFYEKGNYVIRDIDGVSSGKELGEYFKRIAERYQLLYLEDPFAEEDFSSWEHFISIAPQNLIVTGDDLTVTNPQKLQQAIDKKIIRGIIIKPNQIGTVSEAIKVTKLAKQNGITTIASHRSGETDDDFIADFAVGVGTDFAKFGAPVRGERVAKYNRMLAIEEALITQ